MNIIRRLVVKPGRKFLEGTLTQGAAHAARALYLELLDQNRHRTAVRKMQSLCAGSELKLNIGCGSNIKEGWINIDLHQSETVQLDVREHFPFKDNSVSIVYSEHFFEHLDYPREINHFVSECMRCLKPGGTFSVGVPDAEVPMLAYANGSTEFFEESKRSYPEWCNTRLHAVNYFFRQGGDHKYAYDFETLEKLLSDAGFIEAVRRPFDPTLDSELRRLGTLYVDAKKP